MPGRTPLPWNTPHSRTPSTGIYNAATRALAGEEGLHDSFADDEETMRQWSYQSSSPRPSGSVDHRAPTQETVADNHAEDVEQKEGVGMPEDAGYLAESLSENAVHQRQPTLDRTGTSESLVDDLRLMNEESQERLGIAPPTDGQPNLAADRLQAGEALGFETETEQESSGRSEHDASGREENPSAERSTSSHGGSRPGGHGVQGEERADGELRRGGAHRGMSSREFDGSGRPSAASSKSGHSPRHFWEPAEGGDLVSVERGEEDERMGFAMLDDYLPLQNGGWTPGRTNLASARGPASGTSREGTPRAWLVASRDARPPDPNHRPTTTSGLAAMYGPSSLFAQPRGAAPSPRRSVTALSDSHKRE